MIKPNKMTPAELRASIALSSVFGLRMLGMFIILPVFALYAHTLPGGDDYTLVGIALGAYGLTQAILQIPFGWLSDRYSRKSVIYAGLLIFAMGSLIAGVADNIYVIIVGRAIQGAGAISAAVIAMIADLTREDQRTKAMALVGSMIGITFAVSLVAGPALNTLIGVPGIFIMTGVLALCGMVIIYKVDDSNVLQRKSQVKLSDFVIVLSDKKLLNLNYGIFVLHALLMMVFVVIPVALQNLGLALSAHWQVYLSVILGSFIIMGLLLIYAERYSATKRSFIIAIILIALSQMMFMFLMHSLAGIIFALFIFFSGFNLLEAYLPSLVSRMAPAQNKGTAIGIYSSVQFLGIFIGAGVGGFLYQHWGSSAIFIFGVLLSISWLVFALNMHVPEAYKNKTYPGPEMDNGKA